MTLIESLREAFYTLARDTSRKETNVPIILSICCASPRRMKFSRYNLRLPRNDGGKSKRETNSFLQMRQIKYSLKSDEGIRNRNAIFLEVTQDKCQLNFGEVVTVLEKERSHSPRIDNATNEREELQTDNAGTLSAPNILNQV